MRIKQIFKKLSSIPGVQNQKNNIIYTNNTKQNFQIASIIYSDFNGEIIATALHENPNYTNDLALQYKGGGLTRITRAEACSEIEAEEIRQKFLNKGVKISLIVLPKNFEITQAEGMFCRDETNYLSFTARQDPEDSKNRIGEVLINEKAKLLFEYYNGLRKEHSKL